MGAGYGSGRWRSSGELRDDGTGLVRSTALRIHQPITCFMRRTHYLQVFALLSIGAVALHVSSARADSKDTTPWARQPDGWAIRGSYPVIAAHRHISGHADIRCRVGSEGDLLACSVLDETPSGLGFGSAALRLSSSYRVQVAGEGRSLKRQTISIPMNFSPDGFARVLEQAPATDGIDRQTVVRWRQGPSGIEYPVEARWTGVSSRVVVRCRIGPGGALSKCSAVDEAPVGFGFGKLAEHALDNARVAETTLEGRKTDGLTLETTITTNPPCDFKSEPDRRLDGCPGAQHPFIPDRPGRYF